MFNVALRVALLGAAALAAVSLFEQIPILGYVGGLIEIVLWIGMAYRFVSEAKRELQDLASPVIASTGWGSGIGASTALVGVLASLVLTLIKAAIISGGTAGNQGSAAGAAQLGVDIEALGTLLSFFYWPIVGAIVCGTAGLFFSATLIKRGVVPTALPHTSVPTRPPAGTLSADGRYIWNGSQWIPVSPPPPTGDPFSGSG